MISRGGEGRGGEERREGRRGGRRKRGEGRREEKRGGRGRMRSYLDDSSIWLRAF